MAAVMRYQSAMEDLVNRTPRPGRPHAPSTDRSCGATSIDGRPSQIGTGLSPSVFVTRSSRRCSYSRTETHIMNVTSMDIRHPDIGLIGLRKHLDDLLVAIYRLVRSDLNIFRYWEVERVPRSWQTYRDEALADFQHWLDVLEKAMPSDMVALRSHGVTASNGILGLVLQIKVAMILLRTCIDCGPETTFDHYMADFEEIVSRVEHLSQTSRTTEQRPRGSHSTLFMMGLGVLHPLFFVAVKCRDWSLRRRAITQIRRCGEEGASEGSTMALVAMRVAEIEEQGLRYGDFVPDQARVHDVRKSVMYEERVVMVEMRFAGGEGWQEWVVRRECVEF